MKLLPSALRRFVAWKTCEVLRKRGMHSEAVKEIIRNTQATEIFRASFLAASNSPVRITTSDLDDAIVNERCRPSALVGVFGLAGSALGLAAWVLPAACGQQVAKLVSDVTSQQLNDNIRDLQSMEGGHEDLKETIKYHRDIDFPYSTQEGSADGDYVSAFVTAGLANVLKVTKTI